MIAAAFAKLSMGVLIPLWNMYSADPAPIRDRLRLGEIFRRLLQDLELIARPKKHVQVRTLFVVSPRYTGQRKMPSVCLPSVLLTEINSTDNPIFPDEDRQIISGGNFHGQPLAISFDFLAIAMARWSNISERRVAQLIMGLRGLPNFWLPIPDLFRLMIPQYAAASMVNQNNKMYCYAASSDSIVSSSGPERSCQYYGE